jgi:GNAT superfamily N-acetyltransferase
MPEGFGLFRIKGEGAEHDLAERAMRVAGEPDGLVTPRFAQGDEFFCWTSRGEVASFGWVTYRGRVVGGLRLAEAPGRAFLYNFYTLERYRGRGLYPALLLAILSSLRREQITEAIIDVSIRNKSSVKGIDKAGFSPIAQVVHLTLFRHWSLPLRRSVVDKAGASLFSSSK